MPGTTRDINHHVHRDGTRQADPAVASRTIAALAETMPGAKFNDDVFVRASSLATP